MTAPTETPRPYAERLARINEILGRLGVIEKMTQDPAMVAPDATEALQLEQSELAGELQQLMADPCGAQREGPKADLLTCTRPMSHQSDHFDDVHGVGWPHELEKHQADRELEAILAAMSLVDAEKPSIIALIHYAQDLSSQLVRVAAVLDNVGVPRGREERTFTLVQRANLFIDRLSRRLHDQVDNNMILFHAIRDAVTLLVGAPNSGNYRVKSAIEKLRAVLPAKVSPGGIHLQ